MHIFVYLQPFLIDGFKFDLRIYTLVTGCDPFRIFVFKEGLARFATTKYNEPTHNNCVSISPTLLIEHISHYLSICLSMSSTLQHHMLYSYLFYLFIHLSIFFLSVCQCVCLSLSLPANTYINIHISMSAILPIVFFFLYFFIYIPLYIA